MKESWYAYINVLNLLIFILGLFVFIAVIIDKRIDLGIMYLVFVNISRIRLVNVEEKTK